MSNLDYRKRSKTKPCVTKVNGFQPSNTRQKISISEVPATVLDTPMIVL